MALLVSSFVVIRLDQIYCKHKVQLRTYYCPHMTGITVFKSHDRKLCLKHVTFTDKTCI